ncbi:MAG: nucleoside-diphosphate sugar epimerase/dehydratase [Leptolyngbyaceae cyanobacterium MO_188.B28]|nr:nucleoside-diphosphate sugar epimerase/dehydratase [Leptolyngbyaceae cyanobacterium MO_188.B28]
MNRNSPLQFSLAKFTLRGNRRSRRLVLECFDFLIFSISLYLAIALRLESLLPLTFIQDNLWQIIVLIPIQHVVFRASGIYRTILRYSSLTLIKIAAKAVSLGTAILIALTYFLGDWALARSVLIINALLTLILVVSVRLILRWLIRKILSHSKRQTLTGACFTRLIVYGAGGAGVELLQALSNSPQYEVVGFVDDNTELQQQVSIDGLTIYSPQQLPSLWANHFFDTVALAMPSVSPKIRRRIVESLQQQSIPVKTVPGLGGILSGQVAIKELRDVDIADLLGRAEVAPELSLLRQQISGKAVLVTGAGGSIGSELCRQIAQQQPTCLVLYELNEFALYKIHQELSETYADIKLVPCLGNVTDGRYFGWVLKEHAIETLYHAAAYKHVPLLEGNIAKAIENNVLGTLTAAQSAIEVGVNQFVLISTDKAVRPTNIMGATKRVAELIIQALSAQANSGARFAIVRFGNVLGSSGSVVPRFHQQITQGGPITLTHPEITRYFMSIPEAARLVIQAGAMSKGGEVFLLDMGEPVKIYDLATQMIRLSGLTPDEDIQIKITGLRPGEKLYEELLIAGDAVQTTHHPKIYCSQEYFLTWENLEPKLNQLIGYARSNNLGIVRALLRLLVPEYKPQTIVTLNAGLEELTPNTQAVLTNSDDPPAALNLECNI